jgi:hypothetical protein
MSAGTGRKWWSVKLRIEDKELNALSALWAPDFAHGARHVHFGGSPSGQESDPPSITFELQAADFGDAEERAQTAVHRMRKAAKLLPGLAPIIWLAPIGEDRASSRFLDQAKDLIEEEMYELAVVAAQIHFEVQLRELLGQSIGSEPARWSERLMKDRGVAELRRDVSLATVELLLGVDVTQLSEWKQFRDHIERRNDVVHRARQLKRPTQRNPLTLLDRFGFGCLTLHATEADRSPHLEVGSGIVVAGAERQLNRLIRG